MARRPRTTTRGGGGRSRSTDPSTSGEAADGLTISLLENLFLAALQAHHPVPITTTEVANFHGMERDSFSPRPPRMIQKGWIEQCEKRLCENAAGNMRMMITFRLKDYPAVPAYPRLVNAAE